MIDISEARKRTEAVLRIIKRIDDAKDPVVKVGAASIVINRDVPQLAQDLLQALEEIENLRIWKDDHVE